MNDDLTISGSTGGAVDAKPLPHTEHSATRANERAVAVGSMLVSACEEFVRSLNPPARSSSELARATGVNKDIASRVMTAVGKRDPLAVVYYMPGVESLRRLSKGARSKAGGAGDAQTLVSPAFDNFDRAITAYEQFLEEELGGRHALDAMASAWLPEARERFEAASRQMAFRAAANLRGVEAEMLIASTMIHPGQVEDRYDAVQFEGVIGVRRLKPAVQLMVTTFDHRDDTSGRPTMTVDGRPITGDGKADEFLSQFGRGRAGGPPPALSIVRVGTSSFFHLADEGLGAGTASDLFFGQYSEGMFRAHARFPGDIAATMECLELPTQRLVLDVLLHPDAWRGIDPELMHYGTYARGIALPYDRTRDIDKLDLLDTVRPIGVGIDCCRVAGAPRYTEFLRWACSQRGWDPSKFRVFRCDARYPVFGTQYILGFRLREKA